MKDETTQIETPSGPSISLVPSMRGPLSIWEWPEKGVHYCGGVDSSQGVRGGDYSVIKIIRSDTLEECAMWKGYVDPRELGRKAAWLGWAYNTAFMVPEANKDGQSVLWEMKEMGYPNIYRTTTYDKIAGETVINKTLGFNTTLKTRPWLWNHMRLVINHGWGRISSESQLFEMKQIRYDEKGVPFHPRSGHDDETIAWGLALVGRHQAFSRGEIEPEKPVPTTFEEKHWAAFEDEISGDPKHFYGERGFGDIPDLA